MSVEAKNCRSFLKLGNLSVHSILHSKNKPAKIWDFPMPLNLKSHLRASSMVTNGRFEMDGEKEPADTTFFITKKKLNWVHYWILVNQTGFFQNFSHQTIRYLRNHSPRVDIEISRKMSTLNIKIYWTKWSILNYETVEYQWDEYCYKGDVVWLICDPTNRKPPKKLSEIGFDPPG